MGLGKQCWCSDGLSHENVSVLLTMLPQVRTADANSERVMKSHADWVWLWSSICISGEPLTVCIPWFPKPPCKTPWAQMMCFFFAIFLPRLSFKQRGWSGTRPSQISLRTPGSCCDLGMGSQGSPLIWISPALCWYWEKHFRSHHYGGLGNSHHLHQQILGT